MLAQWPHPPGVPVPWAPGGTLLTRGAPRKAHTQHFSPPSLPLSLPNTIWGCVCLLQGHSVPRSSGRPRVPGTMACDGGSLWSLTFVSTGKWGSSASLGQGTAWTICHQCAESAEKHNPAQAFCGCGQEGRAAGLKAVK
uniref:Uncharacterized protein n=2 Tax=Cercopithecinae TaxID=9528 RepID=A0A2K5L3X3_CERAT